MNDPTKIRPRHNKVLCRTSTVERLAHAKLFVPGTSVEARRVEVVQYGEKVQGLNIGDVVLTTGTEGVHWAFLPGYQDLFIIDDDNIPVVLEPAADQVRDAYERAQL